MYLTYKFQTKYCIQRNVITKYFLKVLSYLGGVTKILRKHPPFHMGFNLYNFFKDFFAKLIFSL